MTESALSKVIDAVDLETFVLCSSESEAKTIGLQILRELGFTDGDIVSLEYVGIGARLRLRGTVYKPGAVYHWQEEL